MTDTPEKTYKSPSPFKRKLYKLLGWDLMGRKNMAGYFFVLPFLLGFLLIFLPSFIQSARFSISEIVIRQDGTGFDLLPHGFEHFRKAFVIDVNFRMVLLATARDMVINLPVILIFSFFMAILLNRKQFPGRTAFRIIFFLPVIAYTGLASSQGLTDSMGGSAYFETADIVSMVLADPTIADPTGMESGLSSVISVALNVQALIESLSLPDSLMNFVMLAVSRLEWIIKSSGVQIIVFLAALQSIPTSIFEAAEVEGLTGWEMFWKITLPMVSSMILVNAVYTIVDSYTNESYGMVVTSNTYQNAGIAAYIQKVGISGGEYAYGSALSFIYFAVTMLLIGIVALIASRYVFYNE